MVGEFGYTKMIIELLVKREKQRKSKNDLTTMELEMKNLFSVYSLFLYGS